MAAGCRMAIMNGVDAHPLKRLSEDARCTWFIPSATPLSARKGWIVGSLNPIGEIVIDDGAKRALEQGKSLLPARRPRQWNSNAAMPHCSLQGRTGDRPWAVRLLERRCAPNRRSQERRDRNDPRLSWPRRTHPPRRLGIDHLAGRRRHEKMLYFGEIDGIVEDRIACLGASIAVSRRYPSSVPRRKAISANSAMSPATSSDIPISLERRHTETTPKITAGAGDDGYSRRNQLDRSYSRRRRDIEHDIRKGEEPHVIVVRLTFWDHNPQCRVAQSLANRSRTAWPQRGS